MMMNMKTFLIKDSVEVKEITIYCLQTDWPKNIYSYDINKNNKLAILYNYNVV